MRIKHRTIRMNYAIGRMFKSGIVTPNFDLIYDNENELTVCIEDLLEREWEPDPQKDKKVEVVQLRGEEWPDEECGSWLGKMTDYAEIYNYSRQVLYNPKEAKRLRDLRYNKRRKMKVAEGQKIQKIVGDISQKKIKVDFFEYDKEPQHILVKDLKALLDDSPDDGVLQITLTGPRGFYNLHFDNIRVIVPNTCPLEAVRLLPVDNK